MARTGCWVTVTLAWLNTGRGKGADVVVGVATVQVGVAGCCKALLVCCATANCDSWWKVGLNWPGVVGVVLNWLGVVGVGVVGEGVVGD